jgi:phosphate-selective porin OprO/OprP
LQGARPFHSSAVDLGTVFMQGGYAEALYFLTGENRDYNKVSGVFNRVIPKNNANFSECKYGAWQVGARYDWIDLNSFGINGGQAQDGTLGLNWFLNPNLRIQVNYVLTHVNNAGPSGIVTTNGALVGSKFIGDGYINSVGTRLDWTF